MAVNLKLIELELTQLSWMAESIRRILTIRSLLFEIINENE
jgi:hypothetical protein